MTFGMASGSKNFCKHLIVSCGSLQNNMGKFGDPPSSQIFHNNCIPIAVARSTFFAEDFVVDCDDVAKLDRVGDVT